MIILCWTERISSFYFFLVGQKRVSNLFVFTSLSDREERKLWWLWMSFSIQTLTLIFWNEKHSDTFLCIMVIVESNSVCNHARTTAKRESDLSITSMITDRIRRHEVLLPINHNRYNFRKKNTFTTKISGRDNFGNSPVLFFFQDEWLLLAPQSHLRKLVWFIV